MLRAVDLGPARDFVAGVLVIGLGFVWWDLGMEKGRGPGGLVCLLFRCIRSLRVWEEAF